MNTKVKILFVRPSKSTFIENDVNLFKKKFNVKVIDYNDDVKSSFIGSIKLFTRLLSGILWCDVIFSWFAGYHSFSALKYGKMMKKKIVTVIGGYEIANIPEIGYGSMRSEESKKRVMKILQGSDHLIAVSDYIKSEILKLVPDAKVSVIYNSMELPEKRNKPKKGRTVATVGYISDNKKIRLKGIDTFLSCAERLPDVNFMIFGVDDKLVNEMRITKNVTIHPPLSQDAILEELSGVKVYCQLSMIESFGFALIEGMSQDCIPVVTDRGALPEIVGNSGFVVQYGNVEETVKMIQRALISRDNPSPRDRVASVFNNEQKEMKYEELFSRL